MPTANIQKAKEKINRKYRIIKESKIIETKPVGYLNQPNFFNGVIIIETEMEKNELHMWLKDIEINLGRKHEGNRFGPRTIDLDIIIWNNKIIDNDVYEREFLRKSITEVCPEYQFIRY
jgi:2-amino-4-hydroxy-6-hydroxymethyldihydropteridine diphosphokinase